MNGKDMSEAERPKVELPPVVPSQAQWQDAQMRYDQVSPHNRRRGSFVLSIWRESIVREDQLLAALTEIAEERRRLAVSERATEQVQREMDDMTRRRSVAVEALRKIKDETDRYMNADEALEGMVNIFGIVTAALAKEVPHA